MSIVKCGWFGTIWAATGMLGLAWGQSAISTILGGAPNGLPALSANLNTPSAMATDGNGNVYVILRGAGEVVRIDSQGIVWSFAGGGSGGDGVPAISAVLGGPAALAVDPTGAVYIVDGNRIRRVGPDGIINPFAGNGQKGYTGDGGPALNATFNTPSAMAFDNNGNLYVADTGNQVIREVTTDGNIATFAGTGMETYGGDNGPALQASFNSPAGVAVDNAGNVYIADSGDNLIRVVSPNGTIERFAGVTTSSGGNSTVALDATLYGPTGLALDTAGNLYIVEPTRYRVRRISTGKIATYAGTGFAGADGDGGVANGAELNVLAIALDPQNDLLIADGVNNKVRIVTPGNDVIQTLAGNGLATYNPRGMVVSGNTLYFSDGANNVVRSFDLSSGQLAVVAGNGAGNLNGDGGVATAASLKTPIGLALDSSGNLYIADSANNRVREVNASTGVITTVAGSFTTGTNIGDGGAATSAILNQPYAVAVDSSGNLYIAERGGQRIRQVTPAGTITTVAGTGASGPPGSPAGLAIAQPLNSPQGLAIEPSGSLLIADTANNLIRRLSNGTITTIAGSTSGYGGDGGPATSAMLRSPIGVAEDSSGNIYIADSSNQVIRWVGSDGIINTIAGNGKAGYNGDGSPATAYELSTPVAAAPLPGCTLLVADMQNQRLRQVWPAVAYTITSNPTGLQVIVDGQTMTAPATLQWLPGSQHQVSAPNLQSGALGTQYIGSGGQAINVSCGPAFATVTVNFQAQYALTIASDDGGSVSPAAAWQNPGANVTLNATANAGYIFTGWEGACTGQGACQLVMNGPESVKADFAPTQVLNPTISAVVGAGMSVPPVTALSPNGLMAITGMNFAPPGTAITYGAPTEVNGQISTELDGVCVLVGSIPAPVLSVTPVQINFQVPAVAIMNSGQLSSQPTPVQVVTGCNTASEILSNSVNLAEQSAAPEFFYWVQNANGNNPIEGTDVTSMVSIGSPGLVSGLTFAPAQPGDTVALYGTGFGVTSPSFAAGTMANQQAPITGAVQVSIGSTTLPQADILYAGVAIGAGVYEVDLLVPDSIPNGNQPVQISINGISSPPGAYISIQQ